MTFAHVRERLDALLQSDRPKVLMLFGDWGTGKTYQWSQALARAPSTPPYAYVSTFGLSSLSDLRRRIAEESVLAINLPEGGKVADALSSLGGKLRPAQLLKLLPVLPYVGRMDALAGELSFAAVRGKVICIDDVERAPNSLPVADVLGLANYLKEERQCRVLLISNRDKFNEAGKAGLKLYLEKVVDEWIDLAPTIQEAAAVAFAPGSSQALVRLRERVGQLSVTNIRVIKQLVRLADDLQSFLEGMHPQVTTEAMDALALFGASHLSTRSDLPPVDYLNRLAHNWSRYFAGTKQDADKTPEEVDEERWGQLLDNYGYTNTSSFDLEIGRCVVRGFIDRAALQAEAQVLSQQFVANELRDSVAEVIHRFWDAINDDGLALLAELETVARRAIDVIDLGDMTAIYNVLFECNRREVADELAQRFIAANQHQPAVFEKVNGVFSGHYTGPFAELARQEAAKHATVPTIEASLDNIKVNQGWNEEDVRLVATATEGQVEALLQNADRSQFKRRVRVLLNLGELAQGAADAKAVARVTLELLHRWSAADPVMAVRLRHYLPEVARHDAS